MKSPLALPDGGPLPEPFRWVVGHGITSCPMAFIDDQAQALALRDEFLLETRRRTPRRSTTGPLFARHQAHGDRTGFVGSTIARGVRGPPAIGGM